MSIFRRGPEVGADNIIQSANFAEYIQTGKPVVPENLKSPEHSANVGKAADLLRLMNEVEK